MKISASERENEGRHLGFSFNLRIQSNWSKAKYTIVVPLVLSSSFLQAQERPNLVLIVADQWRGDALGCLNREPVKTPNLDRMAAEGVCYANAVSSYPVSSPARGMLMTGMYPAHTGVSGNCNSDNTPYDVELRNDLTCWSDVMKQAGYRTGYIGKWHLDAPRPPYVDTSNNRGRVAWNEWTPTNRRHGFDWWTAYGTYDYHLRPMYWHTTTPRDSFSYVDEWGPQFEVDEALRFLDKQDGRPFAMVVSMNPPHTGYDLVPEKYKKIYASLNVDSLAACQPDVPPAGTPKGNVFRQSLRNYYACISGVDDQIGRLLEELKRRGLWENTLIVFSSDHGDMMGTHQAVGKNIYYERAMRIPMIVNFGHRLKPHTDRVSSPAFADLAPTMLSLLKLPKPATMQTVDFSNALLSGKQTVSVQPYFRMEPSDSTTGLRGLRTQQYTFAVGVKQGRIDEMVLFDRNADPYELHNIAETEPKRTQQMMEQLKMFLKKNNDGFVQWLKKKGTEH